MLRNHLSITPGLNYVVLKMIAASRVSRTADVVYRDRIINYRVSLESYKGTIELSARLVDGCKRRLKRRTKYIPRRGRREVFLIPLSIPPTLFIFTPPVSFRTPTWHPSCPIFRKTRVRMLSRIQLPECSANFLSKLFLREGKLWIKKFLKLQIVVLIYLF